KEEKAEPNSQMGIPQKINPEKVACFSSPNPDRQLTSVHQQSTTTSPQKNHVQPRVFAKTPSKNTVPPPQKITAKHPLVRRVLAPPGGCRRRLLRPDLRARGSRSPQPAQALRLRRMA